MFPLFNLIKSNTPRLNQTNGIRDFENDEINSYFPHKNCFLCYTVTMKTKTLPDPATVHPVSGYENEIYVKPTLRNPAIIVGDFTYIADCDFESHVSHLYEWNGDHLIIGKFCQIASGVEFVMNGANHQMNAVTTFPFYTLEGWDMKSPSPGDLPLKGDTVIGNDVWMRLHRRCKCQ